MTAKELDAIEDRNLCSNPFRDEVQDDVRELIAEMRRLREALALIAGGLYRQGEAAAYTFQTVAKDALASVEIKSTDAAR